jgi:membrane protein DedA with SNARE-associated domain
MTETLPFFPGWINHWTPFCKAAGFFLATFALEDVAVVGAGLLLAAGSISWPAAFAACFLGVWLGDAGLYALARLAGRGWFERSSPGRFSSRVARAEEWFGRHGSRLLIFSRALPGARLPTYVAAGFLRLPVARFLCVTGAAAFAWTFVILLLARSFGARVEKWLGAFSSGGFLLTGLGLVLLLAPRLLRPFVLNSGVRKLHTRLGRWRRWEFWPPWVFYPPVAIYYVFLAIKYRGAMLPTAANPGIFSGGLVGESKMATLGDLMAGSPEFTAEAELLGGSTPEERLASLQEIRARRGFGFPFILKPDVGQRGAGVKLIRNEAQARACLAQTGAALLVQRFAAGPREAGIFYYRFPHEPRGRIFAITEKLFPHVTGDGQSTIAQLVWRDPRARFMSEKYLRRLAGRENEVLPKGETLKLVETGNHAQGCVFRDGSRLLTPALRDRIDEISRRVGGFFIGRYDIRYESESDLRAGNRFQIVELNGSASEATSIYDARNSLFSAYRTLFRQWDLVFAIGAANRRRGCQTTKLPLLWRRWRDYAALAASYPEAD